MNSCGPFGMPEALGVCRVDVEQRHSPLPRSGLPALHQVVQPPPRAHYDSFMHDNRYLIAQTPSFQSR